MLKIAGENNIFHSLEILHKVIAILLILLTSVAFSAQYQSISNPNLVIQDNKNISINDSVKRLVKQSEEYWLKNNRNVSDSLISLAFIIIPQMEFPDSIVLAEAYHVLGKNLIYKKEYQRGIDTLKKCNIIKQKVLFDHHKSISKTLNYIGIGYMRNQNYDSAIYFCQKAKEPLIKNNISDTNLYLANLNIGIFYAVQGKYSSAFDYFDTALIVLNKSGLIDDSSFVWRYYYNYALFTTFTGKLKEANKYYEYAETVLSNKFGANNIALAGINNNKGNNSYYAYEYSKAELYCKKALEVYSASAEDMEEDISRTYFNLSSVSSDKGDHYSSIVYCLQGLDHSPSNDLKLILNNNIAISYAAIKDDENANRYFKQALDLLDEEDVNPKRSHDLYLSYADFLLNKKNNLMCLDYYGKSLEAAKVFIGENPDKYATVLSKIGTYYLKNEKNADSAINYFLRSIATYNKDTTGFNGDNSRVINEKEAEVGYASALHLKYHQSGNKEYLFKADTVFNQALNVLEEISGRLSDANKLLLIELINPVYILAVENSFELYSNTNDIHYLENISDFIERSKSSALLAEVNTEYALKTSDIPIEIFNYEHQLKDEINGLRQLLGNAKTKDIPDKNSINLLESQLLTLLNTYDSLIIDIENRFPKYYSVKYQNKVISLDKIKDKLADDEVILEYLVADSTLYIMAISSDDFSIEAVPIDSNFYTSLNYIISLKYVDLSKQSLVKFYEFKYHSYYLWNLLIKPHDKLLANNRLIIIPDGLLGYLPFDLLIEYDFETDKINYRDLPYLLKKHPLSYSYSATLRYNTYFEAKKKNGKNKILAFAPVYDENKSSNNKDSLILINLPFAKTEVENIVNNHGGSAFLGSDATKYNFNKSAGTADVLHLAMHTIINDSLPLQSKLIFYNDEQDTTSNYMFTHELYNMDMVASMVTLSACNTGSGKFSKGEGIMSLARGFVYAGIPSIVMTLWEVQDATGSKIMDNFYGFLGDGMKKDVALQKAKLVTLRNANMANAHPFFWSAYVINGDTSELVISNNRNYYYLTIILSLIIILFFILNYRSRKAKRS
ncbi:MAG: CHAT domain-containing protein [Bacteroidetes bacterium]|nr:CHAT domain-containing protein [Bacteroidota bacterium]